MLKFLGVVREAWTGTSLCRGLSVTQSEYAAKILEDAVKLGSGPIRVCTTAGQSGTPPHPKLLPEQPCDPGVRELIGSLLFLSRCTRFDLSFIIARLARFVTSQVLSHTVGRSCGCDASFGTRCFRGFKVKLMGSRGRSLLIESASRLQGPQSSQNRRL